MRAYKSLALIASFLISTFALASDYQGGYFDSIVSEDNGSSYSSSDYDDSSSQDDSYSYEYESGSSYEGYGQFKERCEREYKIAKQVYLSEKAIYEQTKDDRKKDILKGAVTTVAGIAAAVIGHNNGSDTLKYIGLGVGSVGAGYTAMKSYRYIKDGKLERPRAPSYCQGMWDLSTIDKPLQGVYCGQVNYYARDQYGRAASYQTYICGREELEEYRFYMGDSLDCASCN